MDCPACGRETKVIESRSLRGRAVRRRRECLICGKRLTTIELVRSW